MMQEVSISLFTRNVRRSGCCIEFRIIISKEALAVLDGLKASALFREDQYSYILYPNKELPRLPIRILFRQKLFKF